MRSVKLTVTVVATTTLLAAVPAGAAVLGRAARKHPSPNGRCAININVAPRQIVTGDAIVVLDSCAAITDL